MADALNTTVDKLVPEEYIHKTEKTDIEREAEDVFHQLSPEEQKNAPSTDEGAAGSTSMNRAVEGYCAVFILSLAVLHANYFWISTKW